MTSHTDQIKLLRDFAEKVSGCGCHHNLHEEAIEVLAATSQPAAETIMGDASTRKDEEFTSQLDFQSPARTIPAPAPAGSGFQSEITEAALTDLVATEIASHYVDTQAKECLTVAAGVVIKLRPYLCQPVREYGKPEDTK